MQVFGSLRKAMATAGGPISLRQNSPEMDWFVAQASVERESDLKHGIGHLASLLAVDPTFADGLALLARYSEAAGGKLETLLPAMNEQRYFATEALRAYAWAEDGRVGDAIGLLLAVKQAKSDTEYLETWGTSWIATHRDALAGEDLLQFFAHVLNTFAEHKTLTPARERVLRRVVELAQGLRTRIVDPRWDMIFIGLHRKAGLFELAIRLAKEATERAPSWETFTALGLALRESGAQREAVAAFRKAIECQPEDLAARLEAADGWFERGAWVEARAAYGDVLARAPHHEWAEPSALFCEWREKSTAELPDDEFPDGLYELARAGNHRARRLFRRFQPYVGFVPAPSDALANLLRSAEAQGVAVCGPIALTDVEAPSNLVALAIHARAAANVPIVEWTHVATPDPRDAIEPCAYSLWKRDGEVLVPALAPPAADVREAIEQLAAEAPFDVDRSWAAASRTGERLGASRVRDVLACMTHVTPSSTSIVAWLHRVQFAATMVLAHLDETWEEEGGVRRAALMSLLLGPRDWTTTAAIVVLAQLAREQPLISGDVHAAFAKLDAARPSSGAVTYERTLLWQWQALPSLFDTERNELAARLEALTSRT